MHFVYQCTYTISINIKNSKELTLHIDGSFKHFTAFSIYKVNTFPLCKRTFLSIFYSTVFFILIITYTIYTFVQYVVKAW